MHCRYISPMWSTGDPVRMGARPPRGPLPGLGPDIYPRPHPPVAPRPTDRAKPTAPRAHRAAAPRGDHVTPGGRGGGSTGVQLFNGGSTRAAAPRPRPPGAPRPQPAPDHSPPGTRHAIPPSRPTNWRNSRTPEFSPLFPIPSDSFPFLPVPSDSPSFPSPFLVSSVSARQLANRRPFLLAPPRRIAPAGPPPAPGTSPPRSPPPGQSPPPGRSPPRSPPLRASAPPRGHSGGQVSWSSGGQPPPSGGRPSPGANTPLPPVILAGEGAMRPR